MFLPHNRLVGENWSLADGQLWGLLLAWHTRAGLPFPWLLRAGSKPQVCFPMSLVGLLQLLHLLQLPSTSTWVQLEDMAAICVGCSGYNWSLAPKTGYLSPDPSSPQLCTFLSSMLLLCSAAWHKQSQS